MNKKLSPVEVKVLRTILKGYTNGMIAKELVLAESTIKVHLRSITEKLGFSGLREQGYNERILIARWCYTKLTKWRFEKHYGKVMKAKGISLVVLRKVKKEKANVSRKPRGNTSGTRVSKVRGAKTIQPTVGTRTKIEVTTAEFYTASCN